MAVTQPQLYDNESLEDFPQEFFDTYGRRMTAPRPNTIGMQWSKIEPCRECMRKVRWIPMNDRLPRPGVICSKTCLDNYNNQPRNER